MNTAGADWPRAMDIARIAMGRNAKSGKWLADEDPLAWWALVELLYQWKHPKR